MSNQNSSITRVRPVFCELLKRSKTGVEWLSALLRLATLNQEYANTLATNPGLLRSSCAQRRAFQDKILGTISLEDCFEKKLPSSERFLIWLIQHPDRMSWPVKNRTTGERRSYSAQTQRNRESLFGLASPNSVAAVKAEALKALAHSGVLASEGQWWMFEGQTEVDCCLETEEMVLIIEGKRNEHLSLATHWFPSRNQLWRNVEIASHFAGGRRYAVMLLSENYEDVSSSLDASYPHLESHEREFLARHFLGCVSWSNVCKATGVDYDSLPDTNFDAIQRLRP